MGGNGWVGFDLDGTLAHYDGWNGGRIGAPIPRMIARLQQYLDRGVPVRIVTARVALPDQAADQILLIEQWCLSHIGMILPVTCVKDMHMIRLYDDRAVGVITNRGILHRELPLA